MDRRNQPFKVKRGILYINGAPLQSHQIQKELGNGKNGVVYLAFNSILQRLEALKVWRTLDSKDKRNKLAQGLREAQKLAKVSPEYAATIYDAREVGGVLIATMEYVAGHTLSHYQSTASPDVCLGLAELYLAAIIETTTDETRHGDAHANNVMVYTDNADPNVPRLRLKLLDFGTSLYSGKDASEDRHWRLVKKTIVDLTKTHPYANFALGGLEDNWNRLGEEAKLAKTAGTSDPGLFSEKFLAQLRTAPLRDYLGDMRELAMAGARKAAEKRDPS